MTTSQPTNASEWQLYRVLQRANLLQYYDTFVAQGGDDVQQLCEAGEEEFLEIMALVGMASKPLHVRRLQKALQEWVANPAAFQGTGSVLSSAVREPPTHVYSLPTTSADLNTSSWSMQTTPQKSVSPVSMVASNSVIDFQANIQMKKQSSSPQPPPVLLESQINDIAKCAAKLAASLPYFEAKTLNMKKDINKQIFELLSITKDDPNKLELMRKYGAIYRRFDSTRQYEKSMSMHEICVNEASAQLCFHMPSLLTRREDLFPLARQVVKDSGYQYSKGHSSASIRASDLCPANPSKRQKLELLAMDALNNVNNTDRPAREERLRVISTELSQISERQEQIVSELDSAREGPDAEKIETLQASLEQITNKHLQLLTEQSDLLRKQSYEMYVDVDIASDRGDDSNLEASGSSSPSQGDKLEPSPHTHTALKAMLATGQLSKSALGKPGPGGKNSLFDEGLRIAQQYGLGDFAMELKSLQGTDDEKPMEQLFMSRNLMLEQNGGDKITNNDNDPHGKLSPNSKDQNEDSNDSYYENGNGLKPEVIIKQEVMSQHSPVRQDVDSVNGV